jgi:hypothetical protein
MSFRYLIEHVDVLKEASLVFLRGKLLEGQIHPECAAVAHTKEGDVNVKIKSVVLIHPPDRPATTTTLSVVQLSGRPLQPAGGARVPLHWENYRLRLSQ